MGSINMRLLVCLSLAHVSQGITLTTQASPTSSVEMKTEPDNVMLESRSVISVVKPNDDLLKTKRTLADDFGHVHDKISARSYQPDQPYQFYMPVVQNVNDVQSNKIEANSKYTYYVPTREDALGKDEGQAETGKSQLYPVLSNNHLGKLPVINPVSYMNGMVPHFGGLNAMLAANSAAHLGLQNGMPHFGGVPSYYGGVQPQMQPVVILNFGTGYQNPMFKYPQMMQPMYNYQSLLYSMMQNQLANPVSSHPQQTQAIFRSDNLHNKVPFVPSVPFNPEHVIKKQDSVVPKAQAQVTEAVMDPRHLTGETYQHSFNKYAQFNEKVTSV